jgi:hypothetical protein
MDTREPTQKTPLATSILFLRACIAGVTYKCVYSVVGCVFVVGLFTESCPSNGSTCYNMKIPRWHQRQTTSRTVNVIHIRRQISSDLRAVKRILIREMTPCGSYKNRRFGGTYRLHLQGARVRAGYRAKL